MLKNHLMFKIHNFKDSLLVEDSFYTHSKTHCTHLKTHFVHTRPSPNYNFKRLTRPRLNFYTIDQD